MVKKQTHIQVCPQCQSSDIKNDFSNAGAIAAGFMTAKKCNNCGHSGTFFPEIPKNKIKVKPKSKIKNRQYFDKTFSKGYASYFFLFGGILSTIVGLILFYYSLISQGLPCIILGIVLLIIYFFSKRKK